MKYNLLSSHLVLGDELWQNLASRCALCPPNKNSDENWPPSGPQWLASANQNKQIQAQFTMPIQRSVTTVTRNNCVLKFLSDFLFFSLFIYNSFFSSRIKRNPKLSIVGDQLKPRNLIFRIFTLLSSSLIPTFG